MISKSGRDPWASLAKTSQAHTLVNFLRCAEMDALTADITIRLHSLECSGLRGLADMPNVPVVLKATLFPVPGKSKLMRSMADVSTDGSASYSFASQSAVLSMTSAESRGRVYAQGFSPSISIEASFNNREVVGRGSFYLPGALSLSEDDVVALPIKFFDQSGNQIADARASLVMEISYSSAVGPASGAGTPSPAKRGPSPRLSPQQVQIKLMGIAGRPFLGGSVEISMPSQNDFVTKQIIVTDSFKKSSNFDISVSLVSLWPEGDIVTVRVFDDMGALQGEVGVPVLAARSGALREPLAHRLWTVTDKEVMATESTFLIMAMTLSETEAKDENTLVRKGAMHDSYSDDEEGATHEGSTAQKTVTSASEKVWQPVNSLGGTLLGCLQGFLFNTDAAAGPAAVDGLLRYSAEISLHPTDGSLKPWRDTTATAAPANSSGGLVNVPWSKNFDIEIAWALKQRFCLHLNIKIFEEASKSGGRKRLIGEAYFDIVSLVTMKESEFTTFFLPVFSPKTSKKLAKYRTEVGKCVVGMRFFDNGAGSGRDPAPLPPMKSTASSTLFLKTMSTAGSRTMTSSMADTSISKSTKKDAIDYKRQWLSALSSICSKFWSSVLENNMQESVLDFHISLGPIKEASQTAKAFDASCNVVLNVDSMSESFEAPLTYSDYSDSFTASDSVLVRINSRGIETGFALCFCIGTQDNSFCECWVVLSKRSLTMGQPIQLDLPMRDINGLRVAVVEASSHVSGGQISKVAAKDSVRVQFLDGIVNDSTWPFPIDIFFECTLLPPSDYKGDPSANLMGRTNWVSGVSSGNKDATVSGLQCLLDLPLNAVPEAYRLGQIPNNAPKWSISFVGRDASRPGAPAVASGVLSVPWNFFIQGKACQERVALKLDSSRSSAVGVSLEFIQSSDAPPFRGIGSVLFWIRTAQFPQAQGPIGMDSAQVAVRWSRGNAMSGQVFEVEENQTSEDSAIFAVVGTPEQHRDQGMSRERPIHLSVPVPGGHCDMRLRVSSDAYNAGFCTFIPTLATVARLDSLTLFDFPSFNTTLAAEKTSSRANSVAPPRLNYNAIFVPYVCGKLVLNINDIKFNSFHAVLRAPGTKTLAMRFSIGTTTNKFSNQFSVKEVFNRSDSTNNLATGSLFSASKKFTNSFNMGSPMSSPGKLGGTGVSVLSSPEILELPVDTYELMNLPGADGKVEMLDLRCCIVDMDAMKVDKMTIVDGVLTRPKYVKGVGSLPTAGFYYLAAREAVKQPLDFATSETPAGTTPETAVTIPIYGANDNDILGTIHCTIRFVMTGASQSVLSVLQNQIMSASATGAYSDAESATIELGLKQAYKTADSDDSGNISKDELINVLSKARRSSDLSPRDDSRAASIKGLDNAALTVLLDAMTTLADDDVYDDAIVAVSDMTEAEFKAHLDELFKRLDVDGDGSVSWWEWNQMLQAALLIKKTSKATFIDLFDPLVVAYLASNYCVESLRPQAAASPSLSSTASGLLRTARMIAWGGDVSSSELDSMVTKLPPEARGKLIDSINALRKGAGGGEERGGFRDSTEDEETKTRLRVAREEAEAARRLLLAEKEKYAKLESEVVKMKDNKPSASFNRTDVVIENQRSKRMLEEQVATNTERVALAHWRRIQKKNATKTISIFLKRYVKEFRRRMLQKAEANRIAASKKSAAAGTIQRVYRGSLGRKRVNKLWESIVILQRFVRRRKLIKLARLARSAMIAEINSAASRIQIIVRMAQARKEKDLLKAEADRRAREEAERRAREEAERLARAEAERLASEEAERLAREEAERLAREEAEREAARLAAERERRALEDQARLSQEDEARLAALREAELRRAKAAVKIQSVFRGRQAWWWVLRTLLQREVDIVEVVESEAPQLLESIGFWVRVPTPVEIKQKSSDGKLKTINLIQGFVNDVDEVRKVVKVVFEGDESMAEREVPLSTRGLVWFKEVNELVEQDNVLKQMKIVTKADSWVVEIEKPLLLSSVGFLVRFPDTDAKILNYGRIFDVDERNKTFRALLESGPEEVKEFDYYAPPAGLTWLKEIDDREAQRIFDTASSKKRSAKATAQAKEEVAPKEDARPVFDFKESVPRPAFDEINKNKHYVRIIEGSASDPPIDGLVVDAFARGPKKLLSIRLIAHGALSEETHEVQYAYKDPNIMKWFCI